MKDKALHLAKRYGWRVLLLVPGDKVPLRGSHGHKDATTKPSRIRQWWNKHPNANIGVRTGHAFFALDIDPRNGGDKTLRRLEKKYGPLPKTVAVRTSGGGLHLYFRPVEGLKSRNNVLPGIDVKAEGGYVVAPPSINGNGSAWQWKHGRSPSKTRIARAPAWLLKEIRKQQPVKPRSDHPIPEGKRHNSIVAVAANLWRSDMPQGAVREALIAYRDQLCDGGGRQIPDAEIDRVIEWLADKDRQLDLSDAGNAELMAELHGADLLFCVEQEIFLDWDGKRYHRDSPKKNLRMMQRAIATVRAGTARASRIQDQGRYRDAIRHFLSSESHGKLTAMIHVAASLPALQVSVDVLDSHAFLLNVQNGTFDLKAMELREHRKADRLTHLLPTEYDAEAECPQWQTFLERVFDDDEDLIEYVQRAVGYTLTGSTREQCLFLLFGTGANGKSTFLETLRAMFGSLARQGRFESFLVKRGDGIPNDIAGLAGARFVTANENQAGRQLDEATVKQLTGGDKATARFLHQEFFEFTPQFKLWLAANHKPIIKGADEAIWRRIRLIPFTQTIPKKERDPELTRKLRGELPGILAWAVEGCRTWLEQGDLGEPSAVQDATDEYREDSDLIGQFLRDRCKVGKGQFATAKELYDEYRFWCRDSGLEPWSRQSFGRAISERGFEHGRRRLVGRQVRVWTGLGLSRESR